MKTLLFTLLICLSTFGFGQSTLLKEGSFINHVSSDVYHAGRSVLYVYQRPFSWKKKEWLIFGGVYQGRSVFGSKFYGNWTIYRIDLIESKTIKWDNDILRIILYYNESRYILEINQMNSQQILAVRSMKNK